MSALETWASEARVGEMMTYGHQTTSHYPSPDVMETARILADRGLVRLFLKRIAPDKLAYIAQRRDALIIDPPKKPKPKPKPIPPTYVPTQQSWVRKLCAVPGCGRFLGTENQSGVCRTHNHKPGFCKCKLCTAPTEG
jgi:hypothetical protein